MENENGPNDPARLEADAHRYAIRNAYDHQGKADMGALVGKLKALYPDVHPKELIPIAKKAVDGVNAMGMDEIHEEYDRYAKEGFELSIPEKKGGLVDLEWAATEPVVTRFAPNPSAPGHLGHLRPAILSHLYAQKYGGKFILRFDDTDPKLKKPMEGGEQIYLDDLRWFGIVPDMVVRSSDRMEIYQDYMQQLVDRGHAYVCTCVPEKWKKGILKKEGCPCREADVDEQKKRFQKMLTHEYKQGECVLRLKTDLALDDPSQIDWPLARIVDHPLHYRVTNQHLWPVYNFASAIDDHLMGVTLILRGQEHYQNMLKQQWLYRSFGWTYPHAYHHGRMLIKGTELAKSKIILGVQTGKYTGFDDPRLYTVMALRRKGFTPKGLTDLIVDLGLKTSDTTVDLQLLGTFNKKYLEGVESFPLIQEPITLDADFVPAIEANVDGRKYALKGGTHSFIVSKNDARNWGVGTILRLRNAYVVKINQMDEYKINTQFVSTARLENTTQTNWLPGGIDVRITMPTGGFIYGVTDENLSPLEEGSEVLFPGFGYCRVDEKTEKEIRLWYTHA